ncbi:nucleotidyltransferase domain-containing protein [Sulfurisphaera javensis]|uniref:Nucleotidyltransferase domain-containing protein n=1 Tax=Sulfurisphaera javensis TaxID=2049879 RepID=A0AAT9GT44_9CREN
MSSWVKNKFKHLARWREYAEMILRSAKEFDNNVKVYVFGGVAEDRVTVLSDIDILLLFPGKLTDKEIIELRRNIFLNAVDKYGLPFDAPVELHVVDEERAKEYFRIAKKMILITQD